MKLLTVAAGVCLVAVLGLGAWRGHERDVRYREAPACPMAASLGQSCGRCVAAYCCAELSACYGSTECIDLNDCTIECGESKDRDACRARCASTRPQAKTAFAAWDGCAREHCASECPRGEDD